MMRFDDLVEWTKENTCTCGGQLIAGKVRRGVWVICCRKCGKHTKGHQNIDDAVSAFNRKELIP